MTNTHPMALTSTEWEEIGAVPAIRKLWGVEESKSFLDAADHIFGARFDYVSGGPGYCGDLYVLQGDAITEHPPVVLRRKENGRLEVVAFE